MLSGLALKDRMPASEYSSTRVGVWKLRIVSAQSETKEGPHRELHHHASLRASWSAPIRHDVTVPGNLLYSTDILSTKTAFSCCTGCSCSFLSNWKTSDRMAHLINQAAAAVGIPAGVGQTALVSGVRSSSRPYQLVSDTKYRSPASLDRKSL